MKSIAQMTLGTFAIMALTACGGGGGGSSYSVIGSPYRTVYGDACSSSEPTPGCTFLNNGQRVTVDYDPSYDKYGSGSDDLWFVKFDSVGNARVYNDLGVYQYTAGVGQFAGHIGGTTVGVGNTGLYWENVSNGTYWFGQNGVLYNANSGEYNYGQAINNKNSGKRTDTHIAALKSSANQKLVQRGAEKLMKDYGFKSEKAVTIATALNSWALLGAERGKVTTADMDKTFKSVFGVQFNEALAAVKGLQIGQTQGMKEVTNRSASALGLKPHQAQEFIKGMYKDTLKQYGYDVKDMNWVDESEQEGN